MEQKKTKIKGSFLKSLIKEAVNDRLRMIDEAGTVAALEAQIGKVGEDIEEAGGLKDTLLGIENLKHYVNPKTVSATIKELDASIKALDKKRGDLEKQKSKLSGGTRTTAVSEESEDGLIDDEPAV